MEWSSVVLGLLFLADVNSSEFLDGKCPAHGDCPEFSLFLSPGEPVDITIPVPAHISETRFFVQKYNLTSSWKNIILSSAEGSENLLSSFDKVLSFSDGHFKMENMSKDAEGCYKILGHMYGKCVAVIHLINQELELSTVASGISSAEEEPHDEGKGGESRSWELYVLVAGVVVAVAVFVIALLLYKYWFKKSSASVRAYLQHIFSKLTSSLLELCSPQQTEGPKGFTGKRRRHTCVCDADGDGTQGTREKEHDSVPENCEAKPLTGNRDLTQQPREKDFVD